MSASNDEIVRTGVLVERKSITWTLEDFKVIRSSDDLISSQKIEFQAGSTVRLPTKWRFYLQTFVTGRGGKKWIGGFLVLLEKPKDVKDVWAKYTLRIVGTPDGPAGSKFETLTKSYGDPESLGWGYKEVIDRYSDIGTLPLTDGVLTLAVDLELYSTVKPNNDVKEQEKEFEAKSMAKLSKDFKDNLQTMGLPHLASHATLVSNDGVEFTGTQWILSARSPFFRRMFQQAIYNTRVQLKSMGSKTLGILHGYLCTGRLDPTWKSDSIIEEFIKAVNRLELDFLGSFLDKVLGKMATNLEMSKRLCRLAHKFGMKNAEKELFEFIKTHACDVKDLDLSFGDDDDDEPPKKRSKSMMESLSDCVNGLLKKM